MSWIDVTVEDTQEVMSAGAFGSSALFRTQFSATEGGAYADISGTDSTPTVPLVLGTRAYKAYYPAGIATTWYRIRYENGAGTRVSDWSTPFQTAQPRRVCSDGQVKARLFPAGPDDVGDDVLIGELIDQVTSYMQNYTGRWLVPVASATYTFDTVAGYVLRIPVGVRDVTLLEVNNLTHQPDSGGTYTTVAATDYLVRPRSQDRPVGWPATEILLSRGALAGTISTFGTIQNGARVTMAAGFASVTSEIQSVGIDAVVAAYQARKMGASGVIGADMGALVPWSDFFGPASPQRGTLERYRYIGMA